MKFNLLSGAKGMLGKAAFFAKDKSPELCFLGGVGMLIAAGYFVWNGKAKCDEILAEHEAQINRIKELEEKIRNGEVAPEEYTPKMAKADRRHFNMKTAVAFVKVFAPIVLLTVGSLTLFGKSTAIYKGRYLASAAVIAEQNKYIKGLEEEIGTERLDSMRSNELPPFEGEDFTGPREFWFDERSREFVLGDYEANKSTLQRMLNLMNDKLRTEKAYYGNQAIKYMDLHTGTDNIIGTEEGQIRGWTLSKNPDDGADGYIDFGIDWDTVDFAQPVLIRFNWDKRPIWGRTGMAKR